MTEVILKVTLEPGSEVKAVMVDDFQGNRKNCVKYEVVTESISVIELQEKIKKLERLIIAFENDPH